MWLLPVLSPLKIHLARIWKQTFLAWHGLPAARARQVLRPLQSCLGNRQARGLSAPLNSPPTCIVYAGEGRRGCSKLSCSRKQVSLAIAKPYPCCLLRRGNRVSEAATAKRGEAFLPAVCSTSHVCFMARLKFCALKNFAPRATAPVAPPTLHHCSYPQIMECLHLLSIQWCLT